MKKKLGTITAKDCKWDYFRAGGKGGQHQNKASTACRVTHPPSGAVGESREYKSQLQNKQAAWRKMAESQAFTLWVKKQAGEDAITEAQRRQAESMIALRVERTMIDENLLVEVFREGVWVNEAEAGDQREN